LAFCRFRRNKKNNKSPARSKTPAQPTAIPALAPVESEEEEEEEEEELDAGALVAEVVLDAVTVTTAEPVIVACDCIIVVEDPTILEYATSSILPAEVRVQNCPVCPQASKNGCNVSLYSSRYTVSPKPTFSIPNAPPSPAARFSDHC
jgi:hypothetical protein